MEFIIGGVYTLFVLVIGVAIGQMKNQKGGE